MMKWIAKARKHWLLSIGFLMLLVASAGLVDMLVTLTIRVDALSSISQQQSLTIGTQTLALTEQFKTLESLNNQLDTARYEIEYLRFVLETENHLDAQVEAKKVTDAIVERIKPEIVKHSLFGW